MRAMSTDLVGLARRQHGLVSVTQARRAGISARQIERRVGRGDWHAVRPGVFIIGAAPATREQAIAAAVLAGGPMTLASHESAAWLWPLKGIGADRLEVTSPPSRRIRLEGITSHRSIALFDQDQTHVAGIAVMTRERTLVDLSARVPLPVLGSALDDALRRGMRLSELRRCVGRLRKAPGRRLSVMDDLLAARLPGYDPGDSDLETRVLNIIVRARFAIPRQQYRVGQFRLDLAYPDLKVAIELDGWEFHNSRSAFDGDRSRANELVAAGWRVVRFTSRMSADDIVAILVALDIPRSGR
jgi:very-short-patch-repair endonuclease